MKNGLTSRCCDVVIWACVLLIQTCIAGPALALDENGSAREVAWQRFLDSQTFTFLDRGSKLLECIVAYSGPGQLHLIQDPGRKPELSLAVVVNGNETLKLACHQDSVFVATTTTFILADFDWRQPGCHLIALDLKTGMELWRSVELSVFGPFGFSAYGNKVSITPSGRNVVQGEEPGSALIVHGRESFGDYITVVDSKTGNVLAHRTYREGFDRIVSP
jgi:hypothetical protein